MKNMEKIMKILRKIEEKENVEILYAVESGSRIYGFANEDSDYDVRFIYRRKVEDYLQLIDKVDDSISYMSTDRLYDVVGWDISKALKLHYKSNPNLREWILSPIKYIAYDGLFDGLAPFDLSRLYGHYYSLSLRHFKKYSSRSVEDFRHKKYLYIFRSIMCCQYILKYAKEPPININDLIDELKPEIPIKKLIDYEEITQDELDYYNNTITLLHKKLKENYNLEKSMKNKYNKEYNKKFLEIINYNS